MNSRAQKSPESRDGAAAGHLQQQTKSPNAAFRFNDNRPETLSQQSIQQSARSSPQLKRAEAVQAMADRHASDRPVNGFTAVQKNSASPKNCPGGTCIPAKKQPGPPIQGFFDLTEFAFARDAFATCYANAVRFNSEIEDINNTYLTDLDGANTLKNNIEAKGRKASGTVSGESFESREWTVDHLCDDPHIIGPGGGDGIDLKKFYLEIEELNDMWDDFAMDIDVERRVEILDPPGEAYGEVKSARSTNTFLDGVGSALNENNATLIIVYAANGITPGANHAFIRTGNRFIIRAADYGGNTHRADIDVKDFAGNLTEQLTVHNN